MCCGGSSCVDQKGADVVSIVIYKNQNPDKVKLTHFHAFVGICEYLPIPSSKMLKRHG